MAMITICPKLPNELQRALASFTGLQREKKACYRLLAHAQNYWSKCPIVLNFIRENI